MENRIPENHRMLLDELIKKSNTLPWKKSNSKNEIMCKFDNHFIKIFKESNFNFGFQIFNAFGFLEEGSQAMGKNHPDLKLMKKLYEQVTEKEKSLSSPALELLHKLKAKK